jgi:hypothetical protein
MPLSRSDKEWIKQNASASAPAPVVQKKCTCKPMTEAQVKQIVEAATSAQIAEINNKLNTLYTDLQALKAECQSNSNNT